MAAYIATLGPNVNQSDLLQKLKSNGGDAIQMSDGLCIKSEMSAGELGKLLGLEVRALAKDAELTPDMRSFLGR